MFVNMRYVCKCFVMDVRLRKTPSAASSRKQIVKASSPDTTAPATATELFILSALYQNNPF